MVVWRVAMGLVALVFPISLEAKQSFAIYEGADTEQVGRGGTKISKDVVDFWTTDSPPRRFRVLGIMTDERKDRIFDGKVIGSGAVVKKTKEVGGDAVIVLGGSSEVAGMAGGMNAFNNGSGFSAYGNGRVINRTRTQLLVVKYLD